VNRRAFISTFAGGLLAAPLAVEAQPAGKGWRIGLLSNGTPQSAQVPAQKFLQGLRDLGYVEGRDFVMEYRWAEGHPERLPELAADLVRTKVDVIVTGGTVATMAAKQATQTIPIVFDQVGSAVRKGVVASLARPGGNLTGATSEIGPTKLIQMLKEAVPTVDRVVYLNDPAALPSQVDKDVQLVPMRDVNGVAQAFAKFGRGTNGLVIDYSAPLAMTAKQICGLALQRKLPTAGFTPTFANAGCLMSYGQDLSDISRRAAGVVDKIFKGAKPADIPVEVLTKFILTINLKTAKALDLTIPPSLLQRADEVIQ
jgi:putative tryptophan/tyrosine transport system substrate-binding protein